MKISKSPTPKFTTVEGGYISYRKLVLIGAWDMDHDATANVTITGLRDYCLGLQIMIINDTGTTLTPLEYADPGLVYPSGSYYWSDANTVVLRRTASCQYDQFAYSGGGNRGIIYGHFATTQLYT